MSVGANVRQLDGVRREAQLLLCCARTVLDEDARARATSLLSQEMDWGDFLRLVTRQRVVPLVNRTLGGQQFKSVPPAITAVLAQQHDHIARRNLFLTGRLVGLLRTLDTADVRAIAYKGTAVGAVAYGSIACGSSGTSISWCSRMTTAAPEISC